ncbi:O-antigen polymerase [Brevundimonas lenta]|uniref:Oligosaccharide repeat unit polymerase n=1 Tax=Brevundimonas lenta TaxID=424796 RepID=A0A7W6NRF8_9CAUL|nr:O-antigen polymerase [Brevundimonas lenta]MBB4084125.1 hypothetical protein [Brevundimonas lenta]
MKFHPAVLMLLTWASAYVLFFVLPFTLEGRYMSLYGSLIQAVFLGTFCAGALVASRPSHQYPRNPAATTDFRMSDRLLMVGCSIAIGVLAIDMFESGNLLDLAASYAQRSDRATDLLRGAASDSSIWFQIGFLFYPAGYVYTVREIAFRPRPAPWRIALFGMAPSVMAALAMGGRGPLFFLIVFAVYAYALRRQVFPKAQKPVRRVGVRHGHAPARAAGPPMRKGRSPFRFGPGFKIAMGIVGTIFMIYFVQVFITRADGIGGVEMMFGAVGQRWGVSFNGHFSNVFYSLLGVEGTYMVFVFAWYWLQGIVMSNQIFTDYNGPMLLGTYGIDLVSAAMRRINGEFVADGFDRLLRMNVYGFVPSAFGSLYVDFKFFGLLPCFAWGWLTGVVYRNVKHGVDPRWLLLVPFVSVGIVMSLNNTPIGLSNGLMLHIWLLGAFFLSRPALRRQAAHGMAPVRPTGEPAGVLARRA